jgi:esterase/lipase
MPVNKKALLNYLPISRSFIKTSCMKFLKYFGVFLLVLAIVYFLGPKPSSPKLTKELPAVPADLIQLEKMIAAGEAAHKVKPGNEAKIIWQNDSVKQKTEYAIVYLHGFTAAREEGNPIHINLAKKFECNLYLSRLAEHGLDTTDELINFTGDKLWNSAKEAYAIGKQLGNKVILLSTSTGGTVSLMLAAEYPEIAGQIMMSPNIEIKDPNAWLLNDHWGLQIARLVKGEKYTYAGDSSAAFKKYWNYKYRLESVVELEELIETAMKTSTFKKVTQPTLLLYYFKNEEHQDPVVKVSAMKRMFGELGTPENKKRAMAVPNAGNHVMGSYIKSQDLKTVEDECEKFLKEVMGMKLKE